MARELRFWRNVIAIGVAHVALLIGLVRWGNLKKSPPKLEVMWMAASAAGPGAALPEPAATEPTPAPTPEEAPAATPLNEEVPSPAMTAPASEIPLVTPTPTATPRPEAKATPTPEAKKAKKVKNTPEPTPKKKKKKETKASPKPAATPTKKSTPAEKKTAKVAVAPVKQESAGASDAASRAASAAQANLYGSMLHDRFFGAWAQPKTAAATGSRMSALVQVRIEADGRVSEFKIVRASGNVVVDESIAAVAQRVVKVDPLPASLAAYGRYEVRIKFELDVE